MGTVEVKPLEITKIEGVNLDSARGKNAVEALNNEVTTFMQVIGLFMRVCKYDQATAERYTHKIHLEGKAICYWGSKEDCAVVIKAFAGIGVRANLLDA